MSPDDPGDLPDFGEEDFDDDAEQVPLLDEHESAMVRRDLVDLDEFEAAFSAEGYRGVAVWCQDCRAEHYYPWDMLRENLQMLLETGETPVHEPAYEPDPHEYVPWDYARGYVDALHDVGVHERHEVEACPQCGLSLPGEIDQANFCPRCGEPLLPARLAAVLARHDLDDDAVEDILRQVGLPR